LRTSSTSMRDREGFDATGSRRGQSSRTLVLLRAANRFKETSSVLGRLNLDYRDGRGVTGNSLIDLRLHVTGKVIDEFDERRVEVFRASVGLYVLTEMGHTSKDRTKEATPPRDIEVDDRVRRSNRTSSV